MTLVDWLIVAFVILLAVYGYLQGFIVGALSLLGFVAGAFLGSRLAPAVLSQGSHSPYAPLLALTGALLLGGVLATGLEGVAVRLRQALHVPGLGVADGALGAVLSGCVALGIAWVAGAVALQTPGVRELRREVQRSAVLRRLNELLPPSGAILHALARFDPLPELNGPSADVPPPPPGIARDPHVQAARASVVRILGTACGLGIEGSGWVAAPHTVVTNAHVVAGEDDTAVQVGGTGPRLPATVVHFDPHDDVAVLRIADLNQAPLALATDPASGTSAAIMGYPHNGPFDVRPGRIGRTETVFSQDAYGNGPVRRRVTTLRGLVRSGNSGGPMVSATGAVVATVFAATTGVGPRGGFGVPNAIVADALAAAARSGQVGTGGCAS